MPNNLCTAIILHNASQPVHCAHFIQYYTPSPPWHYDHFFDTTHFQHTTWTKRFHTWPRHIFLDGLNDNTCYARLWQGLVELYHTDLFLPVFATDDSEVSQEGCHQTLGLRLKQTTRPSCLTSHNGECHINQKPSVTKKYDKRQVPSKS